jgi:ABC-2 type transport system permease protein
MFFAQLKNELVKLFGKKRTYIGFGAFVLAQSAMLLIFKYTHWRTNFERMLSGNGYVASEYISALTVSLIMLWPQAILLMPLYVALVGGDLVAKEAEDGTLRMILSRPISRVRLLMVKWVGGVIFSTVLVLSLGAVALIAARVIFPWKGMFVYGQLQSGSPMFGLFPPYEGLKLYGLSNLLMVANAVTLISIAFMFSSFNMKPAAATILALSYLFINMVMQHIPFLEQYQNWFVTHHFESWFLIFQTPTPWSQILQSEIALAAISATAFVIGAAGFQVRDIKS